MVTIMELWFKRTKGFLKSLVLILPAGDGGMSRLKAAAAAGYSLHRWVWTCRPTDTCCHQLVVVKINCLKPIHPCSTLPASHPEGRHCHSVVPRLLCRVASAAPELYVAEVASGLPGLRRFVRLFSARHHLLTLGIKKFTPLWLILWRAHTGAGGKPGSPIWSGTKNPFDALAMKYIVQNFHVPPQMNGMLVLISILALAG